MTVGTVGVSESGHLGKNDNNGEIRDQNVFSRTPISTRGHLRAKLRVPAYIMGWNEVHRGHASTYINLKIMHYIRFVRSIAPQREIVESKVGYQNDRWDLNFYMAHFDFHE